MRLDTATTFKELAANPAKNATIRFELVAGLLLRSQIRGLLEGAKILYEDIKVDFAESKGLLESTFSIKIDGISASVANYLKRFPVDDDA